MAHSISVRNFMSPSLKCILQILMISFSIFFAPPASARPERADRMQLYRNSDRGLPYLKLSQTGAASSNAPIVDAAGAPDRAGRRPAAQRARQPLPDRSRGQRGVRLRALQRLPLHAGVRRRRQEAVAGQQPIRPRASRHDPPRHAGGARRRWRRRSGHRALLGRGRQEGADGAARHRRHGAAPGSARQRLAERRMPDRGIACIRPQHALDPGLGAPTGAVVRPRATTSTPGGGRWRSTSI